MKAIKETSIDCNIHSNSGNKEGLSCFSFGGNVEDEFAIKPDISKDEGDEGNKEQVTGSVVELRMKVSGKKVLFAYNKDTNEVYDYQSFLDFKDKKIAAPIIKGKIKAIKLPDGKSKKQFVQI